MVSQQSAATVLDAARLGWRDSHSVETPHGITGHSLGECGTTTVNL